MSFSAETVQFTLSDSMITPLKTVKSDEEAFRLSCKSLHMRAHAKGQNQTAVCSLISTTKCKMRTFNGFVLLLCTATVLCLNDEMSPGVMEKIKAGLELAGKFLGLDQSSSLAQMVSQTFSGKHLKKSRDPANANIFSGFLRLLGLDSKKLSAIAVNAIIFVAQLISSTLSRPAPSRITEARSVKDGTPLDWVLSNSNVANMMDDAKDEDLPNNVIEYIKARGLDEDTDCIQLLICKSAPLVWGMQKALNSTSKKVPKGRKALSAHLPSIDDFAKNGDVCEKKHPYCLIYY